MDIRINRSKLANLLSAMNTNVLILSATKSSLHLVLKEDVACVSTLESSEDSLQIFQPGTIYVHGPSFLAYVKLQHGRMCRIVQDGSKLLFQGENVVLYLPLLSEHSSLSANTWAETVAKSLDAGTTGKTFEICQATLATALALTLLVMGKVKSNSWHPSYMDLMVIEIGAGQFSVFGTDGYRLALNSFALSLDRPKAKYLLSRASVAIILKMLKTLGGSGIVRLEITDLLMSFTVSSHATTTSLYCPLVDMSYPDYTKIFPDTYTQVSSILVPREKVDQILKTLVGSAGSPDVRLVVQGTKMRFSLDNGSAAILDVIASRDCDLLLHAANFLEFCSALSVSDLVVSIYEKSIMLPQIVHEISTTFMMSRIA